MHEFYSRAETEFQKQRKSRNQFCKEKGIPYSSLQIYWNTDKLPLGDMMVDLADYLGVSLDFLVYGKIRDTDNTTESIVDLIKDTDMEQKIELRGIIKQYLIMNVASQQKKRNAG